MGFSILQRLESVKSHKLPPRGLEALCLISSITHLTLDSITVMPTNQYYELSRLIRLRSFTAKELPTFPSDGIRAISTSCLEFLSLHDVPVDNLDALSDNQKLECLVLRRTKVREANLFLLRSLSSLRSLILSGISLSGEAFVDAAYRVSLERLAVYASMEIRKGMSLTNSGATALSHFVRFVAFVMKFLQN